MPHRIHPHIDRALPDGAESHHLEGRAAHVAGLHLARGEAGGVELRAARHLAVRIADARVVADVRGVVGAVRGCAGIERLDERRAAHAGGLTHGAHARVRGEDRGRRRCRRRWTWRHHAGVGAGQPCVRRPGRAVRPRARCVREARPAVRPDDGRIRHGRGSVEERCVRRRSADDRRAAAGEDEDQHPHRSSHRPILRRQGRVGRPVPKLAKRRARPVLP